MTKESRLRGNLWVLHKPCECLCDTVCDALSDVCLNCLFYLFHRRYVHFFFFYFSFIILCKIYLVTFVSLRFSSHLLYFALFVLSSSFFHNNQPKTSFWTYKYIQHRFILRDAIIMMAFFPFVTAIFGFASDFVRWFCVSEVFFDS